MSIFPKLPKCPLNKQETTTDTGASREDNNRDGAVDEEAQKQTQLKYMRLFGKRNSGMKK